MKICNCYFFLLLGLQMHPSKSKIEVKMPTYVRRVKKPTTEDLKHYGHTM